MKSFTQRVIPFTRKFWAFFVYVSLTRTMWKLFYTWNKIVWMHSQITSSNVTFNSIKRPTSLVRVNAPLRHLLMITIRHHITLAAIELSLETWECEIYYNDAKVENCKHLQRLTRIDKCIQQRSLYNHRIRNTF